MSLKIVVLLLAVLVQATEQTKCRNFRLGENIIGVGMNNHLYVRRSTSKTFSWIHVPQSCCVTQIHVMKNGMILGVGLGRHVWKRRTLFSPWIKVPNSCCVKDVTTFQDSCGGPQYIVGVGMNGKLYSKRTLGGRWSGPYANSGTVKAVSGVEDTIYGVGMDNHIYRRYDLRGRWEHIRGSCCVKDIFVRNVNGHPVHGIGMNNRLYTTSLQFKSNVRWTYQGAHTCCIKAVAVQTRSTKLKIIGVGTNKQLYVKPKLSSAWGHVTGSGSVKHITSLKNGYLVGVGMNQHLYYRTIFDAAWKHVPNSCCVKSITQLKSGLIVGVGLHNRLWTRPSLFSRWTSMIRNSGSVTAITAGPNQSIIGIGMNRRLYKRRNLRAHWTGPLANSGNVIDIKYGSDGYLYGIGTDKRIYKKTTKALTSAWRILPHHNCCVLSISVC